MLDVALAIPVREGRVFVARRLAGRTQGGLWEFPGGKLRPDEQPVEAAARELREETGLSAARLDPLLVLVHDYPGQSIRFHVFVAPDPGGDLSLDAEREWDWLGWTALCELEMPPANRPIVNALRWRLTPAAGAP